MKDQPQSRVVITKDDDSTWLDIEEAVLTISQRDDAGNVHRVCLSREMVTQVLKLAAPFTKD